MTKEQLLAELSKLETAEMEAKAKKEEAKAPEGPLTDLAQLDAELTRIKGILKSCTVKGLGELNKL